MSQATIQPNQASGASWANPSNALASDGSVARNDASTGILALSGPSPTIPAGFDIVGFVIRLVAGSQLGAPSTKYVAGLYQAEVAAVQGIAMALVDVGANDITTYIEDTSTGLALDGGG